MQTGYRYFRGESQRIPQLLGEIYRYFHRGRNENHRFTVR